ncbi:MAG: hypothetical protein JW733_07000 [Coriobacteriia bacterium]|nr:hypothetical protein [Coriobacteriia bacterium]MBN2847374.1 hypothetical protein [Coriobacteriia bacterium]
MGLLDSSEVSTSGKRVERIRCDRIGNAGGRQLWWVALGFDDESTKPSGMFGAFDEAKQLADELATEHGVQVVVTEVV